METQLLRPEIFRAYDIRGIVDSTLKEEDVFLIGKAIGTKVILSDQASVSRKVIVARDGRLSSLRLGEKLKLGIQSTGVDVIDLGLVPTPVLYFATDYLNIDSAVMLTGSHNPIEYNGLKIILQRHAIYGAQILELRDLIMGDLGVTQDEANFGKIYFKDVVAAYISQVVANIKFNVNPKLKIVIDCGNGAAGVLAEKLFTALGVECIPLYCNVDGNFPNHHPDPLVLENLHDLIATVVASGADLGIAFDGDGDRLGVVDAKGNMIWPDRYLMLFIQDILTKYNLSKRIDQTLPVIIYDVKSTNQLAQFIKDLGGIPLMWKTGHSVIKAKMRETKALLAGEMGGHVFFNDRWLGCDDGLYTAARLLEIIVNSGQSLSELCLKLPHNFATPELVIKSTETEKQQIVEQLILKFSNEIANIITIDGVRLDFIDSWGLVRASNTSPNLIARFEAARFDDLIRVQKIFKDYLLEIDSNLILPF